MLDGTSTPKAPAQKREPPADLANPTADPADCVMLLLEQPEPEAAGSDVDRVANAELVFEQFKMMWDDEVGRAETIRDRRKLYSTGIALLLGVGVIRISWYRSVRDVAAIVDERTAFSIKMVLAAAMSVLLVAAYRMFTERRILRPGLCRCVPCLKRIRWMDSEPDVVDRRGRAISALDMTVAEAKEEVGTATELVWLNKAFRVRKAYGALVKANERVNQRITDGVLLMGLSFVLLSVAVVWYSVVLDTRRIDRDNSQAEADRAAQGVTAERPSGGSPPAAAAGDQPVGSGEAEGSEPGSNIIPGQAPVQHGDMNKQPPW